MPDILTTRLARIVPTGDQLGEGVVWDRRRGCFWWTDIQQKRLHRLDWASGEVHSLSVPYRIGSLALTQASDPMR